MGVHGLWRLIEPSGKPVPLETLENKVLAVDVSIWLHQAIKGFQDSKGAPLPNAHLLGIYHRVCKLLYFRIRPVFVFDGGVPALKKETIAKRNQLKIKNFKEGNNIQKQLLNTLLKHAAVSRVLSETTKASLASSCKDSETDDIYKLPLSQESSASSEDEYTSETDSSPTKQWDLHTIDEKGIHFKSLPIEMRHEILTELKETRKQSSWGRLHEIPRESGDFSSFQMKRLLKRYSVQASLEQIEKEMGGNSLSLQELESILNDQGVVTSDNTGRRIASDENTRYLLIKDVKKAMEEAKREEAAKSLEQIVGDEADVEENQNSEFEEDLQTAIELSLQEVPSTSRTSNLKTKASSNLLTSAKNYMIEYSGLTPSEIEKIIGANSEKATSGEIIAAEYDDSIEMSPEKPDVVSPVKQTETVLNCSSKEAQLEETAVSRNANEVEVTKLKANSEKTNNREVIEPELDDLIEIIPEKPDIVNIVKQTDSSNLKHPELEENVLNDVEEMSDSDSNDFLEVPEPQSGTDQIRTIEDKEKSLEIVINPSSTVDDLFIDIFDQQVDDEASSPKETEKPNLVNPNSPIDLVTDVVTKQTKPASLIEELRLKDTKKPNLSNLLSKQQITPEEVSNAEEIKTFISKYIEKNTKSPDEAATKEPALTTKQLKEIETNLDIERKELVAERSTKERMSNNITDQMYQEAQELLELFGVPYIIAPMEAEAQCAFLDAFNLTDGTITDDSDIWLFGGRTVYKNFFNQTKHVSEFKVESIQDCFKLSREQMILLALLVGSDYTTGLQGIGPVTALEILATFPLSKMQGSNLPEHLISGLIEFRTWFAKGQVKGQKHLTLKRKLKNVSISQHFPSLKVIEAYLDPKVETSKEKFSWAKPDKVGLIDFAKEKFGWTQKKSEEILQPVMQRLNETHIQKSIKDYFKTKHKIDSQDIESKMSKRVKQAVKKMGQETQKSSDEETKILKETKKQSKKKLKQMNTEIREQLEKTKRPRTRNLHKKETIPQKERDKSDLLRSKLKAIEVFRTSKQGPGFMKKHKQITTTPKEDAELSESSSE